MRFTEWFSQPSTQWALGFAVVVSGCYIIGLTLYFGSVQALRQAFTLLSSPDSAFLAWYIYGGWALLVATPIALLVRFSLVIPFVLVVVEQSAWLGSNPDTTEFAPLAILVWPISVTVLLLLAWVEYRLRLQFGLSLYPLIR